LDFYVPLCGNSMCDSIHCYHKTFVKFIFNHDIKNTSMGYKNIYYDTTQTDFFL
jgi:hypothetical protein